MFNLAAQKIHQYLTKCKTWSPSPPLASTELWAESLADYTLRPNVFLHLDMVLYYLCPISFKEHFNNKVIVLHI